MSNRRAVLIVLLSLAAGVGWLASCSWLGFFGPPCQTPKRNLTPESLLGTWRLTYPSDQWVSDPIEGSLVVSGTTTYLIAPEATPMSLTQCERVGPVWPDVAWEECPLLRGSAYRMEGQETVTLNSDGTYQQTFVSSTYSYTSPLQHWEFITDAPDGPKLRMHGMKYFSEGIRQANSSVHITLSPQRADRDRWDKFFKSHSRSETAGLVVGVAYPEAGFIYLYPRKCERELSLVQMGFRVGSDDWRPNNPVFRRE